MQYEALDMGVVSLALLKLVLIASLGFFLYKKNYIEEKVLGFLTFFVIYVTIPSLIFSHLIGNAAIVLNYSLGVFLFLALAIFSLGYLLGFVFSFKMGKDVRREFICGVSFQNCGYLPMNIALFLFPSPVREEFLIYIFLYILGFNVILWSVGSFFIFKKKGERFKFNSLFTPPIISTGISLIFIYAKMSHFIPSLVLSPIKMVGDSSFVLSMIILGCWLAKVKVKGLYARLPIIIKASFLKLAVVPLLFLAIVYKMNIFSLLGLFIILEASMPSAASLPIVVNLRGADSEFVSQGVFLTHVFSIITVPLWLGLFLKLSGFSF